MSARVLALVLLIGAAAADLLGSPASIEEFPSQAQVECYQEGTWVQRCSASVLTNRHVLSVATCFDRSDNTLRRIRAGSSIRGAGGDLFYVEEVINHPDFGLLDYDADITIVRLEGYLTFSATVRQAPILGQGIELPGGLVVAHAGWGTTAEGGQDSSDALFAVDLTVTNEEDCLMKYIAETIVTENMVCLGLNYFRGRDFDFADKGGALFYEDTLVALLSFGKADANDEYPAVATSVGAYADWIIRTAV